MHQDCLNKIAIQYNHELSYSFEFICPICKNLNNLFIILEEPKKENNTQLDDIQPEEIKNDEDVNDNCSW